MLLLVSNSQFGVYKLYIRIYFFNIAQMLPLRAIAKQPRPDFEPVGCFASARNDEHWCGKHKFYTIA